MKSMMGKQMPISIMQISKAKNAFTSFRRTTALTKEEINYFDTLITLMENANYYDVFRNKRRT